MAVCTSCGACCAHFRVSFYWAEADARGIPDEYVVPVGRLRLAMRGTEVTTTPRCIALEGVVGEHTACSIYERRPQPCRELEPGDGSCERARARHALPALS
jgi:hypothetical protein